MGFAIAGGAALVGSMISANAASDAASTEANAANNASRVLQNQNNLSRQDMQPWLDSGRAALGQLNQQMPNLTRNFSMADFQQDPGYQFNLQQGQQAIERSAAARGGLNSGATMKSLGAYTQGQAANQYQNAFNNFNSNQSNTFNRLASMAGVGQAAATQNSQNGMTTAQGVSANMQSAGNAMAAGTVGQANAINGAIGTGTNLWMQNQMLNRMGPQSYGSINSPTSGTGSSSGYNYSQNPQAFFNNPYGR